MDEHTLETETVSGDGYPGGLLLIKVTKPCTHETEDMHDKMENKKVRKDNPVQVGILSPGFGRGSDTNLFTYFEATS